MSRHISVSQLFENARIVEGPVAQPGIEVRPETRVDRNFELPRALYLATVGLYLGFLAIMATGLSSPGLIIPMAIFAFFIIAGFALPTIWARLKPDSGQSPMSWQRFSRQGIQTHTGWLTAGEASVQMLILPSLIVVWALVCVTIAAIV